MHETTYGRNLLGFVTLAAVTLLGLTTGSAQVTVPFDPDIFLWNSGGPSTAYGDAQNWTPNGVPATDGTVANINSGATGGNQVTLGAGDVVAPDYLNVYTEFGDGGVLNIGPGAEVRIGVALDVSTEIDFDLCDVSGCWAPIERDTASTVNQTGGIVTVGTDFRLGRDITPETKGVYNFSAGSIEVGGNLNWGDSPAGTAAGVASAEMNMSGDSRLIVRSDWSGSDIDPDGNPIPVDNRQDGSIVGGQFNITQNATVVFENPNTNLSVGGSNWGDGLLHIKDNGSLTVNGSMSLANQQANGDINDAEFRMEGGTATLGSVELGGWHSDSLEPELGREEAFFNLSGGSVTATSFDVGGFFNSHGELNVSGGTLEISGTTQVGRDNTIPFDVVERAEGIVNISDGFVQTSDLVVGLDGTGTVNQSGGTLKVDFSLILGQNIDGQGTYNLSGGTLDMNGGDITFGDGDGTFNFDGGTIQNAANISFDLVNNGGTLSPGGSAGATNIGGDYLVISSDAALEIELGGTGAGQFDKVAVSGEVLADGSLNVALIGGFTPSVGNNFDILDFSALTGQFASVNLPALGGGLTWDQSALLTNGVLSIIAGGSPALRAGDADQNLKFDQLDLVKVQIAAKYLTGQPATWGEGDWNGAPGGQQGSPPAGDGVFNQFDIVAAQQAAVYLTGPYAAIVAGGNSGDGQTSIGYNPSTGEIFVDAPAGTDLTSVNIDSAGGIFTGAAAQNLGGSFDNDADGNIFKATFGGSFGSLTFGNVARTGLSQDFVLNDLTVVGSLAGGGALGNVDLIYVPEPTALVLLVLGVIGLLALTEKAIPGRPR